MDKEYKYKPGDFGDIKDMVRKANELSDLSWEERANDFRLTGPNEDTSVKTAAPAKKSASTAKNSRGKSSGSRKSSADTTAKESKTTKSHQRIRNQKKPNRRPKLHLLTHLLTVTKLIRLRRRQLATSMHYGMLPKHQRLRN